MIWCPRFFVFSEDSTCATPRIFATSMALNWWINVRFVVRSFEDCEETFFLGGVLARQRIVGLGPTPHSIRIGKGQHIVYHTKSFLRSIDDVTIPLFTLFDELLGIFEGLLVLSILSVILQGWCFTFVVATHDLDVFMGCSLGLACRFCLPPRHVASCRCQAAWLKLCKDCAILIDLGLVYAYQI